MHSLLDGQPCEGRALQLNHAIHTAALTQMAHDHPGRV